MLFLNWTKPFGLHGLHKNIFVSVVRVCSIFRTYEQLSKYKMYILVSKTEQELNVLYPDQAYLASANQEDSLEDANLGTTTFSFWLS